MPTTTLARAAEVEEVAEPMSPGPSGFAAKREAPLAIASRLSPSPRALAARSSTAHTAQVARAALFVATSLALHAAATWAFVTASSAERDAADAPHEPSLLEGAALDIQLAPRETVDDPRASSPSRPAEARSAQRSGARTEASRDEVARIEAPRRGSPGTGIGASAAHRAGSEVPEGDEVHEGDASGPAPKRSASADGAPRTIFGTAAILRSFLLAVSAYANAREEARGIYRITYEGGDGAPARVSAAPEDAAGLHMARTLEALLSQASAGLPALAGALVVEGSRDMQPDGVFTITCDDARRTGSVRFPDGRRVRVDEAR
jgi:hypothetical protein